MVKCGHPRLIKSFRNGLPAFVTVGEVLKEIVICGAELPLSLARILSSPEVLTHANGQEFCFGCERDRLWEIER